MTTEELAAALEKYSNHLLSLNDFCAKPDCEGCRQRTKRAEMADEAAARLRELDTALRPFAAVADAMRETSLPRIPDRDDLVLWQRTNTAAPAGYEARITLGDCRRAKAALEAR